MQLFHRRSSCLEPRTTYWVFSRRCLPQPSHLSCYNFFDYFRVRGKDMPEPPKESNKNDDRVRRWYEELPNPLLMLPPSRAQTPKPAERDGITLLFSRESEASDLFNWGDTPPSQEQSEYPPQAKGDKNPFPPQPLGKACCRTSSSPAKADGYALARSGT